MVKVGILHADNLIAGEIIRILINHPEIELTTLYASNLSGINLSTVHHGLIGENPLFFSDRINLEDIDFLIITENSDITQKILSEILRLESIKLGTVGINNETIFGKDFVEIGISEINRKALVRGARVAYIPSNVVVTALIALIPLANYLLLNSDIDIDVKAPSDISEKLEETQEAAYIKKQLVKRQVSFNGNIRLQIQNDDLSQRASAVTITLRNSLPLSEIENIYDGIYDDHNFTFITKNQVTSREVVGTQKVIIQLNKPEPEILELKVFSDSRMRGGAGDVVHLLNLFFGLHEKTGLHLKPSCYQ